MVLWLDVLSLSSSSYYVGGGGGEREDVKPESVERCWNRVLHGGLFCLKKRVSTHLTIYSLRHVFLWLVVGLFRGWKGCQKLASKNSLEKERKKKASDALQPDQYLEPKWLRYLTVQDVSNVCRVKDVKVLGMWNHARFWNLKISGVRIWGIEKPGISLARDGKKCAIRFWKNSKSYGTLFSKNLAKS